MNKFSFLLGLLDRAPFDKACLKCKYYISKNKYITSPCPRCVFRGGDYKPELSGGESSRSEEK